MGAAVDRLTERYLELVRSASPTTATWLGFHEADGELDDLTEENLDAFARGVAALKADAAALDVADSEEAADRDGLVATLAESLFAHEVERPWRRNPFEAATVVPSSVLLLIARDFAPKAERLAHVAARLEAAPRLLQQARSLLDEPCPALWRQMAIQAARGGARFLGETLPGLAAGTELAARVRAASEQACDALGEFAAWLEHEHAGLVGDDATFAIGSEALERRLREVHCFRSTPEQLTAIGEAEVARTSEALAEQAAELGGDDWAVTLDRVKQRHPSADELVGAYRRELASLERFVFEHDLATNPQAEAVVEATPEFLRGLMGFAAYLGAGPFDAFQQGYFWVTPPADDAGLTDHSYASIPAIAAHEGYPGHHLQVSSVNRLASVTRRALRSPVMIEGWGLYTEELMHDAGYYDAEARLAQLAMRLLRAVRIILDMGLQTGALTYEQAVEQAVELGKLSEPLARTEVARYTMTPTQPCSYLLGALELERLRADSAGRLGNRFRLHAFHDRVLSYGHMPTGLVARAMAAADTG